MTDETDPRNDYARGHDAGWETGYRMAMLVVARTQAAPNTRATDAQFGASQRRLLRALRQNLAAWQGFKVDELAERRRVAS